MSVSDTPVKSSPWPTGASVKEHRSHADEAVKQDLRKMFTAAKTDDFFDTLLRVDPLIIDDMFEKLEKKKLYDNNQWKGMVKDGKAAKSTETKEKDLYEPFVKIANAITSMVASPQMQGKWVNCSDKAPKSKDSSAAKIRPDVGFVSKETDPDLLKIYNQRLDELEGKRAMQTRSMTKAKHREELREEQYLHQIWWQQMLGPGEFKIDDKFLDALLQLCVYVRSAFREQLDRRFIIGFTLCVDKLNIYLFDRSGVIGTQESINIHREPKKFVQFLACYSTLSAERLGWDPTMQLYSPESEMPLPSYTFPWSIFKGNKIKESLYDSQWVITLNTTRWITIRALTIVGAEIMCGRATAVWEVVKFEEFKKKTAKEVCVLKQSWQRLPGRKHNTQPDEEPFELFAYGKAGFASRLKDAECVLSGAALVRTLEFIRNGLRGTGITSNPTERLPKRTATGKSKSPSELYSKDHFVYKYRVDSNEGEFMFSDVATQPVSRRQTRILMNMRGWPLTFFRNLLELLQVILDAVEDHRTLYFKGVLHRDISGGNILILIYCEKVGRLIDLDHAKVTNDGAFINPLENALENELESLKDGMQFYITQSFRANRYISLELLRAAFVAFARRHQDKLLRNSQPGEVNDIKFGLAAAASRAFADAQNYIEDLLDVFSLKGSAAQPLLPEHVWPPAFVSGTKVPKQPSFADHAAGPGYRTGTLPFMSHAILNVSRTTEVHDAIHDIESFLWIIINIALDQEGPGGHLRIIEDNPALKDIIFRYFESRIKSDLASWKGALFDPHFESAQSVLETILAEFAPYFIPLRPFVRRLWKLLWMAFKYRAYELWCIHDLTLSLLGQTIKDLKPYSGASSEERKKWTTMEEAEEARRKKYLAETLAAIKNHTFSERAEHIDKRAMGADVPQDEPPSPSISRGPVKKARKG